MQNAYVPTRVCIDDQVAQVSLGTYHSMFMSPHGHVFICGRDSLVLARDHVSTPEKITEFDGEKIKAVSIAAATSFSLIVNKEGHIWAWGDNSRGQLGLGTQTLKLEKPEKFIPVVFFPHSVRVARRSLSF